MQNAHLIDIFIDILRSFGNDINEQVLHNRVNNIYYIMISIITKCHKNSLLERACCLFSIIVTGYAQSHLSRERMSASWQSSIIRTFQEECVTSRLNYIFRSHSPKRDEDRKTSPIRIVDSTALFASFNNDESAIRCLRW